MADEDNSDYGDESSGDEVTRIEQQIKKGAAAYKAKPIAKKAKDEGENLVLTQNAYAAVRKEIATISKGTKVKAVLQKKKTVKDNKGDEWEVTDKREKVLIEKPILSDSEEGSELSFD